MKGKRALAAALSLWLSASPLSAAVLVRPALTRAVAPTPVPIPSLGAMAAPMLGAPAHALILPTLAPSAHATPFGARDAASSSIREEAVPLAAAHQGVAAAPAAEASAFALPAEAPSAGIAAAAHQGAAAAVAGVMSAVSFAPRGGAGGAVPPAGGIKSVRAKPSGDYARMFDLARRVLSRPEARKFLREVFKEELTLTEEQQKEFGLPERVKELSESQFMLLLQHNPQAWPVIDEYLKAMEKDDKKAEPSEELAEKWRERFRGLLEDEEVRSVFAKFNDTLTPMRLDAEDGGPGYSNARVFANHQTIADGKTLPASDLKKVLIDFIAGAETELMFNVFDFDLMDVADALIERAKAGVKITGGIDKGVVEARPEVKAVFDKLSKTKGITMRAVDSVGLNHQKLVARDFNDPRKAKALFSSGNFTQSCIGPEGDLDELPPQERPKDSVPNANHLMTVDSYLLAQAAANSLTKTLVLGLRGDEYPLGGAYKVLGEKAAGDEEAPWMIVSFSPKGGLGDINRDMTRRLILSTRGPLRLLQFAFSSEGVRDAIIERARLEKAEGGSLDLKTVGDTPFAARPWSVFLELAGYLLKEDGPVKEFIELADNALRAVLGEKLYAALRKDIRVGPRAYRNHVHTAADGAKTEYGSKIHHKVLISGAFAVLGTSFNFSEAANHNQEQFLVTSDRALVAAMTAVFDGMFAMSPTSLAEEVERRNGLFKAGAEDEETKIGGQYEHVDEEAARSRKKR